MKLVYDWDDIVELGLIAEMIKACNRQITLETRYSRRWQQRKYKMKCVVAEPITSGLRILKADIDGGKPKESLLEVIEQTPYRWTDCWKYTTFRSDEKANVDATAFNSGLDFYIIKNCGFLRVYHKGKLVLKCRYAGPSTEGGYRSIKKAPLERPKLIRYIPGLWTTEILSYIPQIADKVQHYTIDALYKLVSGPPITKKSSIPDLKRRITTLRQRVESWLAGSDVFIDLRESLLDAKTKTDFHETALGIEEQRTELHRLVSMGYHLAQKEMDAIFETLGYIWKDGIISVPNELAAILDPFPTPESEVSSEVKVMTFRCPDCKGPLETDNEEHKKQCPWCGVGIMIEPTTIVAESDEEVPPQHARITLDGGFSSSEADDDESAEPEHEEVGEFYGRLTT